MFTSSVLLVTVTGAQQPRLYLPFKFPGIRRMLTKVESSGFERRKGRNNARIAYGFFFWVFSKQLSVLQHHFLSKENVHLLEVKQQFLKKLNL